MSLQLGAIEARLALDTSGYTRPLLQAQGLTEAFGSVFSTALVNPVVAGVQAVKSLGGAVFDESKRLIDLAEKTDRLAKQTGVTSETQQTLSRILVEQGQAAEGADAAILKYTTRLGDAKKDGGLTVTTLRQLGIELSNLERGDRGLYRVLDQLAAIEDETVRAAAASELFDRQFGPALATALGGGAAQLDEFKRKFKETGVVIDESAVRKLLAVDDALDTINRTIDGLKTSSVTAFLEGLAGSSPDASRGIEELASAAKGTLIPAMRELGGVLAEIVKYFSELKDGFEALKSPGSLVAHAPENIGYPAGSRLIAGNTWIENVASWSVTDLGQYDGGFAGAFGMRFVPAGRGGGAAPGSGAAVGPGAWDWGSPEGNRLANFVWRGQ